MHHLNSFSIRTLHHIHPPAPAIPTLLIQRDATQRGAHLQALESRDHAWFARARGRFAVPHHQRAEAAARVGWVREDGADASAVGGGVAGQRHAQEIWGAGAAVEGFAEGPWCWGVVRYAVVMGRRWMVHTAAAGADCCWVGCWVQDEIGSVCAEFVNVNVRSWRRV
jgi:hypothetical protein